MSLEYHTLQQHSHYAQLVSHIRRGQFSAVLAHLDSPQHAPLVWSVLRQRDRHNRTLLHHAAEAAAGAAPASSTSEALALVQALLDAPAASSELLDAQDTEGSTALHFAVITGNASLVRLLLQRMTTAQVNIADYELHTPMHWAVVCGRLLCVQLLLEAGAQLDMPDIYGAHPLHYATQSVSAPLTAAGDMFVFPSGRPGRHAAHQPQPPPPPPTTSNTTQQRRPGDQLRLLHYLLAIRLHVDVNCTDNEARTPLIWAASSGNALISTN